MYNSAFLTAISQDMRQKGYALKTEKTYIHWIKHFIIFNGKRHLQAMGCEEVRLNGHTESGFKCFGFFIYELKKLMHP